MDKNGLDDPIPSRNQNIGDTPEIKTATGTQVTDNDFCLFLHNLIN